MLPDTRHIDKGAKMIDIGVLFDIKTPSYLPASPLNAADGFNAIREALLENKTPVKLPETPKPDSVYLKYVRYIERNDGWGHSVVGSNGQDWFKLTDTSNLKKNGYIFFNK